MKTFWSLLVLTMLIASLCIARSRSHREAKPTGHAHAGGPDTQGEHESISFKEGKGLRIPERTAQFIGLQIEDVNERGVTANWRFDAQVYRAAGESRSVLTSTALASGLVNRSEAALLRPGDAVSAIKDGVSFRAQVTRIEPMPVGAMEVLLAITDEKGELEPGVFVTASVSRATGRGSFFVSSAALLRTVEGNFVYTVSGDRFVRTAVTAGAVTDEVIEITDGLYAGDRVVVQPVALLWMAELQSLRGGKSCADGH